LVAIAYLLWAWLGEPAPVRIPCESAVAGSFAEKAAMGREFPQRESFVEKLPSNETF
jgi:hypothetical protein